MISLYFLMVAGVLLGGTHASDTPLHDLGTIGPSTFSIQQTANPGYVGFATTGQAALAKIYAKINKPMPAYVASAVAMVKTNFQPQGEVGARPEVYDSSYHCPVQIGSLPQTLFLNFDTGSSDLWVFSSETSVGEVFRQTLYMPNKSSTAKKLAGHTWTIEYGDGSYSTGDVYIDNVSIGGVKVTTQAVESAKDVSFEFTFNSAQSGLLGLAFEVLNTVEPNQQATFFDNVKGVLEHPLFTVDLKADASGSYDFGYIDEAKMNGSIHYTPVNSADGVASGFWEVIGTGYAVGKRAFVPHSIDAIIDTGSSLLMLPDDVVQDYYFAVPKATFSTLEGGWIFPCKADLPDFVFGVGKNYRGRVPGPYINFAPSQAKKGYCFGGIQSDVGIGFSIWGDVLLKAQFVVFDGGNTRVGFASKAL